MGIANRVALVTGSASGMGKQTAQRMAESGACVAINDIDGAKVDSTVAEFKAAGLKVIGVTADISRRDAVEAMVRQVIEAYGRIDILVNNAGLEKAGPLRKLTDADWDLTVNVNLKGAFLCSQAAHGSMVQNKHGRIINIASRAWLGGPGQAPYSSAKAGVVGMTRTLALELGRNGVTTNCIAPGLINTPMWEELPDKDKAFMRAKLPTGEVGDPDDIANAVMFLADDDAGYINGQVLYVCGGRSLYAG